MLCGNVHEGVAGRFYLKCAWCRQVIGESDVKDSHGMCEDCYRREVGTRLPPRERPAGLPRGGSARRDGR